MGINSDVGEVAFGIVVEYVRTFGIFISDQRGKLRGIAVGKVLGRDIPPDNTQPNAYSC
jgi:hypothetical protein